MSDELDSLRAELADARQALAMERELAGRAKAEAGKLLTQLAWCSVAASGATGPKGRALLKTDDGWSPAYEDVLALREKYARARAEALREAEEVARRHRPPGSSPLSPERWNAAHDTAVSIEEAIRALPAAAPPRGKHWVSWYAGNVPFTYEGPWWNTGTREDGRHTICAAVMAESGTDAMRVIEQAHGRAGAVEWRFVEAMRDDWEPFNERFPRADWMQWPNPPAPPPEDELRRKAEAWDRVVDTAFAQEPAAPPVRTYEQGTPLTFAAFSTANRTRCEKDFRRRVGPDAVVSITLGLAEEAGEVAGKVRAYLGLNVRKSATVEEIGDELADLVTYADLLASCFGLDLGAALAAKFNRVSERVGSDVLLSPPAPPSAPTPVHRGHCNRCDRCGWTFASSRDNGCVPGDCSYRPEKPEPPRTTCAGCGAPYEATPPPAPTGEARDRVREALDEGHRIVERLRAGLPPEASPALRAEAEVVAERIKDAPPASEAEAVEGAVRFILGEDAAPTGEAAKCGTCGGQGTITCGLTSGKCGSCGGTGRAPGDATKETP